MNTKDIIPFSYVVTVLIPASGTVTKQITLNADSEFELNTITAFSGEANQTDVAPNYFSVKITDLTTGRQLTNVRVNQSLITGNANNSSFTQRRSIRFLPNSNLEFDFANLTANEQTVELVLHGYKVMLN